MDITIYIYLTVFSFIVALVAFIVFAYKFIVSAIEYIYLDHKKPGFKLFSDGYFKNLIGNIKRGFYKTVIAPFIYRTPEGYNAKQYWEDRFTKYGNSILGTGNEGLSEFENAKQYLEAAQIFKQVCKNQNIDLSKANVLDIGCGNGYYTKVLYEMGVQNYTGIDITKVRFKELAAKFPRYLFYQRDITKDVLNYDEYDLVVMIDVLQHIVTDRKLFKAMYSVQQCMSKNGVFILSAICKESKKEYFYVRHWTLEDVKQWFPGYSFSELIPFRGAYLVVIRKG